MLSSLFFKQNGSKTYTKYSITGNRIYTEEVEDYDEVKNFDIVVQKIQLFHIDPKDMTHFVHLDHGSEYQCIFDITEYELPYNYFMITMAAGVPAIPMRFPHFRFKDNVHDNDGKRISRETELKLINNDTALYLWEKFDRTPYDLQVSQFLLSDISKIIVDYIYVYYYFRKRKYTEDEESSYDYVNVIM